MNDIKTVILSGGFGTRLGEETSLKPKPMVEIGHKPILWHIMNIYAAQGFKDFVLALGYKGEMIKDYFLRFYSLNNNLSIDLSNGNTSVHDGSKPTDWKIDLIDTGLNTMTGGRVKRIKDYVGDKTFMLTYGDGVSDIDIKKVVEFHKSHGKMVTVTAVRPTARFGELHISENQVKKFDEKPQAAEGWINGGFFVLEPEIFEFIDGDTSIWERAPLETMASRGEVMAYQHEGFWQCMDTLREKNMLEDLWNSDKAPWKVWE